MPPESDDKPIVRDSAGRFAPGTRGGPGSGVARRVARARGIFLDATLAEDGRLVREIVESLRGILRDASAKDQDRISAAKVLLETTLGKASEGVDLLVAIEEIEERLLSVSGPGASDVSQSIRAGLAAGEDG